MGRVSSTAASTLGTGVSSPSIQNIIVVSNTEATVTIPTGSRRFYIKHSGQAQLEIRYAASPSPVWTNTAGNIYVRENLAPTTTYTLYITANKSGTLQVESWS